MGLHHVQPIAAYDWTLFIGNHVHFLPSYFQDLFVCLWLESLVSFPHFLSANLTPYLFAVCIQLEPVSSMYPVIFQLLKEVNNSLCPVRHTLTPPATESRYLHDWRRSRYEFMSTIDSCHWVLLYCNKYSSEAQAHLKLYFSVSQAKASRSHSVYGKQVSSSKLCMWSFITRQPTKSTGHWRLTKCPNSIKQIFLSNSPAMTSSLNVCLQTIKCPNMLIVYSVFIVSCTMVKTFFFL